MWDVLLYLYGCNSSIKGLRSLRNLKFLSLDSCTKLQDNFDAFIEELVYLKQLEYLNVCNTPFVKCSGMMMLPNEERVTKIYAVLPKGCQLKTHRGILENWNLKMNLGLHSLAEGHCCFTATLNIFESCFTQCTKRFGNEARPRKLQKVCLSSIYFAFIDNNKKKIIAKNK